jgi:hypothetical protein
MNINGKRDAIDAQRTAAFLFLPETADANATGQPIYVPLPAGATAKNRGP